MLNFYNYVVGFVDLLGQRDEFKGQGLLGGGQRERDHSGHPKRDHL